MTRQEPQGLGRRRDALRSVKLRDLRLRKALVVTLIAVAISIPVWIYVHWSLSLVVAIVAARALEWAEVLWRKHVGQ